MGKSWNVDLPRPGHLPVRLQHADILILYTGRREEELSSQKTEKHGSSSNHNFFRGELHHDIILLLAEILHQLIGSLSHYLQGFIHPRWCRISSINSMCKRFLLEWMILCHNFRSHDRWKISMCFCGGPPPPLRCFFRWNVFSQCDL